jgi:hypothetical protein
VDVEKDEELNQSKNSNLNLSKLKAETKKNIEETINKNNLNQDKSQNNQAVVKAGKSLFKKVVNNIEPELIVKDAKRNNYRRSAN